MKNKTIWIIRNAILIGIVVTLLLAPVCLYAYQTSAGITYLLTSLLFAAPLVCALLIAQKRWVLTILLSLVMVFSITDTIMVAMFGNYINAGNVLAVFSTTASEGSHFVADSIRYLWYSIPCSVLFVCALYLRKYTTITQRTAVVGMIFSVLLVVDFVAIKVHYGYKDKITLRYFVDNRIWNRPPYNVPYQMIQAELLQRQRKYIADAANMSFNSRGGYSQYADKSTYVLAIGESCNYEHFSMNGTYFRETTPRLSKMSDAILYSDYYSTGCLTMWSVPQIVTRATPKEYELNYKEKSIFKPFQECGYKTFFVVSKMNLLGYEKYLSAGCDSLYNVDSDQRVIDVVDSLSQEYDRVMFVVEFLGNHHPYFNYTTEYDVYHPNINSDAKVKSDSLYINAYDNTVLYTDYVLFSMIENLKKQDGECAFLFVSDHGEGIGTTGGGHGGDCSPTKIEYHVPLLFWTSEKWQSAYPEKQNALVQHQYRPVNGDNVFYTMCGLANIELGEQYRADSLDITTTHLKDHPRYILVPDGKNVVEVE